MFPYVTIYGGLGLLGLRDVRGHATPNLILLFVFLTWFAGLRYYVGCDYESYLIRYNEARTLDWSVILGKAEFGFGAMTALFAKAGLPFWAFQGFASAVIVGLYTKFASRYPNPVYLLALFFPILILQLGMSGLRQAMAVGFILLAFNAYVDKKRWMIALWVVVAFQFHNSAIIFLPMAFIAGREISIPRLVAGFVLIAPIVALILGDRIEVYTDRYIDQIYGDQQSSGAWFRYFLALLPVPFFFQYRAKIKQKYPEVYQLLLFAALFICTISLTAIISSVALHRLTLFAFPLSILMTLYICLGVLSVPVRGMIAWLGIYGAYISVWFATSRHATVCYTPYQNVSLGDLVAPAWAVIF